MQKYPSIEQFRNVIRTVRTRHDFQGKDEEGNPIYSHTSDYPTLSFKSTVKLHGTNAGIVLYKDRLEFQSRERVLGLTSDNAGFMLAMSSKDLTFLWDGIEFNESIAVYGEWCGGNIQKGVGICQLPKMFVIFGYKVDGVWVDKIISSKEQNIYHIEEFPTHIVDIDFNNPEAIQNKLIELTLSVEEECPVAKYFGVSGIGEGLVFTAIDDADLKFKSKGEKHSVSKVKKLNEVDVEALECINDFVVANVTENRLQQGLSYFRENGIDLDAKNTGQFLSWIVKDILKEEGDTIEANNLDERKVKHSIVTKARMWFLNSIS